MRNKLKRHYGMGHLHFLTFSCYRRKPPLGTVRARNRFVKILGQVRARFGFLLVGYVVMPDHVHLLISEPHKGTSSTSIQVLKQRVSRDPRNYKRRAPSPQLRFAFSKGDEDLPRFWQPRFYDFNVYSTKKKRGKLEYMHANPVKRGVVKNPAHWMWSSYLFYEKGETGLLKIDPVD